MIVGIRKHVLTCPLRIFTVKRVKFTRKNSNFTQKKCQIYKKSAILQKRVQIFTEYSVKFINLQKEVGKMKN